MLTKLLSDCMAGEHITEYAPLPLALCHIGRAYLLERLPFRPESVLLFLIPYYAGETVNLSRYAAAGDYHAYARALFARVCPVLSEKSGYSFAGFSDHSPIDERRAAALAGLGMAGKNGLLLSPRYGSFVFIAEFVTDAPAGALGFEGTHPIRPCPGCGACLRACPTGILRGEGDVCLSALTQKKGTLTPAEEDAVRRGGSVWGCDVCQLVCPVNRRAIDSGAAMTPLAFFRENRIPVLTRDILDGMDDAAFSARAFSFRGRAPLLRNLALLAGDAEKP